MTEKNHNLIFFEKIKNKKFDNLIFFQSSKILKILALLAARATLRPAFRSCAATYFEWHVKGRHYLMDVVDHL